MKGRTRPLKALKWVGIIAGSLIAIALIAAVLTGYVWLRGSLPVLDGERDLPGLSAQVTVERDAKGVPTIQGANRSDVARATGFLHGQDRFFQMDLSRRSAAGELAELIGPAMLAHDRRVRVHRFRALAQQSLERLEPQERTIFEAYTEGVRAGVAALKQPPFEYRFLRTSPQSWEPEDSVLVVFAMYQLLQDESGVYESTLGLLHDQLPTELVEFLVPAGTNWDAPLLGEAFETPAVPPAEIFDLRSESPAANHRPSGGPIPQSLAMRSGSNNWAVAGSHTADGFCLTQSLSSNALSSAGTIDAEH